MSPQNFPIFRLKSAEARNVCAHPPKKIKRIDIVLLHWLWRMGAEIFAKLPQETADVSQTAYAGEIGEQCSGRRTYTARPRPASLPLTSKNKCLLDRRPGAMEAEGGEAIFPLAFPAARGASAPTVQPGFPAAPAWDPQTFHRECAAGSTARRTSRGAHIFLLSPQRCRSVTADFIV